MNGRICWLALASFVAAVSIFVALPTSIDPIAYSFSDEGPPKFIGPLALNEHLSKARKLFKDEIQGPEAFATTDGYVYTGLQDGRIIRFDRTNPASYETIVSCPDAKKGILSIDLDTRRVQILVNAHQPGNGIAPLTFVDDLVVLSNGSVFFTDLSKKFGYDDVEAEVMEARPNGRLFHFSPSDGSLHTALEGLHGANGVCVGPNEEFLLVAELTRARVTRYYLKGPKAGTVDTFAQNLPGLPDNITPSSRGGYWVGFGALRDNGVLDMMAGLPWLRALVYKSKLMASIKALVQKHGMIVELDASGQIVRSLHDPNGVVVTSSTTVLDLGDTFLIGSYYAPYITKMSLDLKRRYPLLVAGLVPTVLLSVAGRIIGLGRRLLFGFRKQRIPTLFTIGFSHYCDKVRWALELISGYDFEERPYLPLVHIPMVLAHTGVIPKLLHSSILPPQQKDIEEFEKLCDDKLGPNARILAYGHIFSSRRGAALVASMVLPFTSPGLVLKTFLFCYPLVRQVLMFALNINESRVAVAFAKVDEVFAEANRRLAENGGGRGYLCGTAAISAADLAFASLAYPVVFPPELGGEAVVESSPEVKALAEKYRNTPAGKYVLRLYKERGPVQFRRRK
eukprot:Em0015g216a